ncbi:hypothetical protein QR680_004382 [Steinernema hermaphroditum]|uniref:Nuclear receptor domain-containing protein n=1 Tax=Steinernema hermaphroditum TaxID=289476 RepID=A0AA39LTK8_9BILA|nr:hypothetical protein QR680_004382 [Steinernema hermaphroditum]
MMICCICSTRPVAGVNYGAASCCSCAAFFRRTVRMRIKYDCDKNELRCSAMAIHLVQEAQPFRRKPKVAIRASMSPSFQPASHLPLISATIEVLKQAFLNHTADRKSITVGTSEFGQNFYTYDHFRRCFLIECELFRKILNATPVIRELDSQSKDAVFRNSFLIYMPFVHTYYHIRQTHSEEKQSRYYMFDNAYMDIDPVKLQYFMALNGSSLSLASLGDYLTMARSLSAHLVTLIKEVAESAKHVLNTDEDIAALFLLVLIQSNAPFGKKKEKVYRKCDIYSLIPPQSHTIRLMYTDDETLVDSEGEVTQTEYIKAPKREPELVRIPSAPRTRDVRESYGRNQSPVSPYHGLAKPNSYYVEQKWSSTRAQLRGPERSKWRGGRKRNGAVTVHTATEQGNARVSGVETDSESQYSMKDIQVENDSESQYSMKDIQVENDSESQYSMKDIQVENEVKTTEEPQVNVPASCDGQSYKKIRKLVPDSAEWRRLKELNPEFPYPSKSGRYHFA